MLPMVRRGVLPGAAVLAALTLCGSASGAASDGAQVTNSFTCTTDEFFTLCVDEQSVFRLTTTPAGLSTGSASARIQAVSTGTPSGPFAGCVSTGDTKFSGHFVDVNDINFASQTRLRSIDTLNCLGAAFDCTFTFHFAVVDGRVLPGRLENVCTTPQGGL
jgi:hypothetical protein